MDIKVRNIDELPSAAHQLLQALGSDGHVLAFHAAMGVGKTTLIAELCRQLGVTGQEVNSPTFAIINVYEAESGPIYHFDMYRLTDSEQAMEIGAPDYLESGDWCFVEWPENTPEILPTNAIDIFMTEQADGIRVISIPSLP